MRREPAKVWVGEGVLPAPPLPLKPTVGRLGKTQEITMPNMMAILLGGNNKI
jgi:hypothetical protein